MNSVEALYAVTRLSWYELHQLDNVKALALFRMCRGFQFPLGVKSKDLTALWDSLLIYIFGQHPLNIPPQWLHFIEASFFALDNVSTCRCCQHLHAYFANYKIVPVFLYKWPPHLPNVYSLFQMDPLACCLVLCAKIKGDSKTCSLCHCELPHSPKWEYDSKLVGHFEEHHPQVELICQTRTFNYLDPHVKPTIQTWYIKEAHIQCDHHFE